MFEPDTCRCCVWRLNPLSHTPSKFLASFNFLLSSNVNIYIISIQSHSISFYYFFLKMRLHLNASQEQALHFTVIKRLFTGASLFSWYIVVYSRPSRWNEDAMVNGKKFRTFPADFFFVEDNGNIGMFEICVKLTIEKATTDVFIRTVFDTTW